MPEHASLIKCRRSAQRHMLGAQCSNSSVPWKERFRWIVRLERGKLDPLEGQHVGRELVRPGPHWPYLHSLARKGVFIFIFHSRFFGTCGGAATGFATREIPSADHDARCPRPVAPGLGPSAWWLPWLGRWRPCECRAVGCSCLIMLAGLFAVGKGFFVGAWATHVPTRVSPPFHPRDPPWMADNCPMFVVDCLVSVHDGQSQPLLRRAAAGSRARGVWGKGRWWTSCHPRCGLNERGLVYE
jgi:hypothetical protein